MNDTDVMHGDNTPTSSDGTHTQVDTRDGAKHIPTMNIVNGRRHAAYNTSIRVLQDLVGLIEGQALTIPDPTVHARLRSNRTLGLSEVAR